MVWIITNEVEDTLLQQFFLSSLYLFDSIFSDIVWIDKLHNCVKRICFNVPGNGCKKEKKYFINNKNLVDWNYHCKG